MDYCVNGTYNLDNNDPYYFSSNSHTHTPTSLTSNWWFLIPQVFSIEICSCKMSYFHISIRNTVSDILHIYISVVIFGICKANIHIHIHFTIIPIQIKHVLKYLSLSITCSMHSLSLRLPIWHARYLYITMRKQRHSNANIQWKISDW